MDSNDSITKFFYTDSVCGLQATRLKLSRRLILHLSPARRRYTDLSVILALAQVIDYSHNPVVPCVFWGTVSVPITGEQLFQNSLGSKHGKLRGIDMPALITVKHFCDEYGISRSTAYRLRDRHEVPHVKIGRAVRIRREDAERWYDALSEQSAND